MGGWVPDIPRNMAVVGVGGWVPDIPRNIIKGKLKSLLPFNSISPFNYISGLRPFITSSFSCC